MQEKLENELVDWKNLFKPPEHTSIFVFRAVFTNWKRRRFKISFTNSDVGSKAMHPKLSKKDAYNLFLNKKKEE